ncbi:SDR family NAD(P)-dependent oxidoreductase [Bradyrhizobium sp. AS23.2]|uniref:SDR family NAD(P)-dependent oxidoreductase n=1 Tax=Bradyrhizobium sp. AS23.2 TaxID=1680155 RepID=UPI00093D1DD2|nr:SDR family NAD(P)-dependent oxidoreductase [Bradyrhizobium sp. AS23.2]OKO70490.1 oxidoreductase [Bradyrhizobium sp. AS23.2]
MRSVVITGTSTGIGWSAAKILLDRGFRVFGSVRKAEDAARLKGQFGANFVPLMFDVTDEAAVFAAAAEVRTALGGGTLAGLVNNAGIVVAGPTLEVSLDDYRRQMEINAIGPISVTRAFAPLLGAAAGLKGPPGRIVMISSVSGVIGSPFVAPYSMSKHALEGFSESLRRELLRYSIDVIVIGPAAVKTPIWAKAQEIDVSPFAKSPYFPALLWMRAMMLHVAKSGLPVERIGELIHKALTVPRPKVRYAPSNEPFRLFMMQILPKRLIDRFVAGQLGLLPELAD